ncbi:chaplin [Streptomyces sp. NPDC051041]|uniref:chaplin n=1 Tax=Streptomyces sp. NPDC051041 TaxID=3365640 RepID=UPI0037905E76
MRQVTRKGLMTVAAATGVIAAASGAAHAHGGAAASGSASGSPGVLSGNLVQAPVHVPVNVCGNTVDVVGVLNPSVGNTCANHGDGSPGGYGDSDGHGGHDGHGEHGGHGGSQAGGHTADSPGVGSGNHVQVPIHAPVNVCGNSVNVVGVGNAALGDDCANGSGSGGDRPATPPGGQPGDPGAPDGPGGSGDPGGPGDPDRPDGPAESGRPGTPAAPPSSGEARDGGSPHANQPVTLSGDGAQLAQTGSGLPLGATLPMSAGALLAGAVLYRKARASA